MLDFYVTYQLFSVFLLTVKPTPNVAMSNINVKIIHGTLAAPNAKLKDTKKMTAKIENIQKMPFDFFVHPIPHLLLIFSLIYDIIKQL